MAELFRNFFTHKDFLAPAHEMPGTMFTPLHFIFAAIVLAIVIVAAIVVGKREKTIKPVFIGVWATVVVLENRLRKHAEIPIIGRIVRDRYLLDTRTLWEEDFDYITDAVKEADQ